MADEQAVAEARADLTVSTTVNFSIDRIVSVLVGFWEDRISTNWVRGVKPCYGDVGQEAFKEGAIFGGEKYIPAWMMVPFGPPGCHLTVTVDDPKTDDALDILVDRAAVAKGLQIMAEKYPRHFSDVLTENDDVETADVLAQCILFGEIIYS